MWGPQSDARYCCGHAFSPIFAGLSECRFSIPAPESHRSVVSLSSSQTLYRSFPCKHENSLTPLFLLSPKSLTTFQGPRRSWQNHIPSSRSFSCNRLSGNKKSRHTNAYRLPAKRIDLSLAVWLHIHVTGFEIQSRNCHLRFSNCRQLGAIQKRRYFLLAYRRRCPAESRHPKSVKKNIQLQSSNKGILYYTKSLAENQGFLARDLYRFYKNREYYLIILSQLLLFLA